MVVLHIASIKNNKFNGVHVAVPQHIYWQQQFENVAVINLTNAAVENAENQFEYSKSFSISSLPEPFCAPDLVVFHEIYKFDYVGISAHLRKEGIPYIVVPHGSLTKEAQRKKWLKKLAGNIVFFNAFINGAAAIQFLSEKEKENSRFGKVKFAGTNGVSIPNIKKDEFSKNEVKFLYIGSLLWRIKGLDLMLSAIEKCSDKLSKCRTFFEMYGPHYGDRGLQLQKMISEYGVSEFVTLYDAISGEDKAKKLSECDIFIQTSRSEGMPMGVLEALSYGLPCLVTEGTNLGELISSYDAGWVAKTDSSSIADAILRAINERHLWAEKSKNARRLVEENFAWETVARGSLTQYGRVISNYH